MDAEMREALDRLGTNLLGEIRSGAAALRGVIGQLAGDLRDEMRSGDADLRGVIGQLARDLGDAIRSGDAENREALGQQVGDLRGEMRSVDADLRGVIGQLAGDLRGEIQSSAASFLHELSESETRMRRHFDVVVESFHGDTRSVAEGTALVSERTDRRFDEQMERSDALEGRVVRLEVRVKSLEDDRKPRRPRRRR